MRKWLSFIAVLLFGVAAFGQGEYVPGRFFVKVRDDSPVKLDTSVAEQAGLGALFREFEVSRFRQPAMGLGDTLERVYVIECPERWVNTLMDSCSKWPFFEYVERVPLYTIDYIPNDFDATVQSYLLQIGAPGAWDVTQGSSSVVIAVVDNAVSMGHEDLQGKYWVNTSEIPGNGIDDDVNGYVDDVNGFDLADVNPNTNPPGGMGDTSAWVHGTHCSGLASGATDNNTGLASIGFNCTLMPIKVTPDGDNGKSLPYAYDGVIYAIRNGADVISMSFGGRTYSKTIELLMLQAHTAGIVLVAAAGNSNTDTLTYPAAYPGVIAVAAVTATDFKANFSNYGIWVDICAPGVQIPSYLSGSSASYGVLSGTSMSTPIVAGVCGLLLSAAPNLSPAQIEAIIKETADPIDHLNPAHAGLLGAGRINAGSALARYASMKGYPQQVQYVFPNPIRRGEAATLALPAATASHPLYIFGLDGRLAHQMVVSPGQTQVKLPELSPGTYLIQARDGYLRPTKLVVVY